MDATRQRLETCIPLTQTTMDGAVTCKLALDRMKTDETTAQDNSSRLFRADSAVLLLFGQPRGANGNCLFLSMALQVQPEDLKDIPSRPGRPGPMGTNLQRLPDFSRSLRWVELPARRVLCGHG